MKEYIVYSLAVFLPLGALMSLLLRKQGLLYKHIVIIVGFSLMVIISFPLAIKTMGWMFSLFFYVAILSVLIWYLLNGPEGAEPEVYSEEIVLDLSAIKDPTMKEIKTVQGMLDEARFGNIAEKVGDRLVKTGAGLEPYAEFQQVEFQFEEELYGVDTQAPGYTPDKEYAGYEEPDNNGSQSGPERSYLDKWVDHHMEYQREDSRPEEYPQTDNFPVPPAVRPAQGTTATPLRPVLYKEEPVIVAYEPEWLSKTDDTSSGLEPETGEKELDYAVEPALDRHVPAGEILPREEEQFSIDDGLGEEALAPSAGAIAEQAHEQAEDMTAPARLLTAEDDSGPGIEYEETAENASGTEGPMVLAEEYERASEARPNEEETIARKRQVDYHIDHGFAAKFAAGWEAAAYHFEEALDMAEDAELRYLVVNELAYIYREEGLYKRSLELLQGYLNQEAPADRAAVEIGSQIRYFALLADELERFGKPGLPYAMVPRMIRMNVDSAM